MDRTGKDGTEMDWKGWERKGFPSGVHSGEERKGAERTGMERNGWDWIGHLSCIHNGPDRNGGEWSELDRRGSDGKGLAFLQASTTDRTELDRKGQERMG